MIQQSIHTTDETFELQTYNVIRNTLLCSTSRYDEFLAASGEIYALRDYLVVGSPSVPHNTMYLADNEGYISTHNIVDDINYDS